MLKALALALLALAILSSPAAQAVPVIPPPPGPFAHYEQKAIKIWGAAPYCPGGIEYSWFHDSPGNDTGATALDCHMRINIEFWARMMRGGRCQVFAHEWAHLLGWDLEGPHPMINSRAMLRRRAWFCNNGRLKGRFLL